MIEEADRACCNVKEALFVEVYGLQYLGLETVRDVCIPHSYDNDVPWENCFPLLAAVTNFIPNTVPSRASSLSSFL